ncbi:MAG: ATP-binding protein [Candidatus Saccharibacteria bacterium]|nr:ATP-binding protein [Candidatus Saccharibacteria bacterium]
MKSQTLKQLFGGSTKRIRILGLSFFAFLAVFGVMYYMTVVSPNVAGAFSGSGAGTLDDPYRIASCAQLQEMKLSSSSAYVLTQDIDCNDTINWNDGSGFEPVSFSGSFDGRNYSIEGLYINRPNEYAVGLFSIKNNNFIINLKLINGESTAGQVAINGGTNVGAIVGELKDGVQLSNVHSELNVQGNDLVTTIGGLVGYSNGFISKVSSSGMVSVAQTDETSRSAVMGGIVGTASGQSSAESSLEDSFSTGATTIGSNNPNNFTSLICGGAVGDINQNTVINKVYATGQVSCSGDTASRGGLIGIVSNSSGDVSNNPNITDSFATGLLEGTTGALGGLIGNLQISGLDLSSNYFNSVTTAQNQCSGINTSTCQIINDSTLNYFYDGNQSIYTNWNREIWQFDGSSLSTLKTVGVRADPPTDLQAIRDGSNFNLSWTAPVSVDGRSEGITDYQIYYRNHNGDRSWIYYDDGISTANSAVISGLTIPGNYDFKIKAMSDNGSGLYSEDYNFATGMPDTAPQNIQNTPGAKTFTFNWDAVDAATSYQLRYRKTGDAGWIYNGIIEYSNLQAIVRVLEEQTSYEFQISAVNAAGNGPWSDIISVSTTAVNLYSISNCEELQAMRDDLDGTYVLANDIDCANLTENGSPVNFQPVGNGKLFFAGSLDGKNFKISNMTVDISTTNNGTSYKGAGLFGVVAGATLKNIRIDNSSVTGFAVLSPEIDTDGNGLPDGPGPFIDLVNPQVPTTGEAITSGQEASQQSISGVQTLSRWALGTVAGVVGGSGTYSNIFVNNTAVSGAISGGVFGIVVPLDSFTEDNGAILDLSGDAASLTLNNISSSGAVYGFISGGLIGMASAKPSLSTVKPGTLTLENSFSTASVEANIGGGLIGFGTSLSALALIGTQNNTPEIVTNAISSQNIIIKNSYSTGQISACQAPSEIRTAALGGLIGAGSGVSIESSYATGSVSTCSANNLTEDSSAYTYGGALGGLSGALIFSTIKDSHATGNVQAINTLPSNTDKFPVYIGISGGLSGFIFNSGDQNGNYAISNSYATGNVLAESPNGLISINGGLIGVYSGSGTIQSSHATGQVKNTMLEKTRGGASISGGLVGVGIGIDVPYTLGLLLQSPTDPTYGLVINNSYATGEVRNTKIGPGIGLSISGGATGALLGKVTLANSHATGNVVNDARNKLVIDSGIDNEAVATFAALNDSSISIAGGLSGVAIGSDIVPTVSPDLIDPATAPAAIRIDSTFASGSVNGLIAGGLIGSGELSLSINKSYAKGAVQGSLAGGIAGQLGGTSVIGGGLLGFFNIANGNSEIPLLGFNAATYIDNSHTIDVTNTYATGDITGVRNLLQLNPEKRNANAVLVNDVSTYTPSAIGGLVGVFAAPGGLLENSYASGKLTMPNVTFPQGREPNQLKAGEIPAVAGGVIGVNLAIPKPNLTLISSEDAANVTDLNEFVTKPQTIRNVFSASQLSLSEGTITAGFSGLTISPVGAITGDNVSESNIFSTTNNYFDRSTITVNDCVGPAGAPYDTLNAVYKSIYYPDASDNNTLDGNIPNDWTSTYIDPVVKRPACNIVNVNNSQPKYFINNKANAPLASWNFNGLWFTQEKDYPKFVAGAVTPENPGPGPGTPKPPLPPTIITPPTEITSNFTNPTTVGYVRNLAKKLGRVNADPQRVKGLKVLIASVPPFIAQSLPYLFILLLLLLAALYSWQALRQYSELSIYRKSLARVIATKESVDNFLAITTHYLNTPVAIMGGAVELLVSLNKITKEKAGMLTVAIKKNADDAAQLLVANQVSGAQANSDVKQISDKQTNPLFKREVWVPALISLSLVLLANIMFIYAEVFSRSRIRIGIEVLLFVLSLGLVVLAYRYRDMLEDTKRIAREQLRIEKELYEKRSTFIPKAAEAVGSNVTAIRNASAGLRTIPQSALFFNGLAKLEEVGVALNNLTIFANVSDHPPLFDITTYVNRVIKEKSVKAKERNITITSDIDLGVVSRIQPAEIKEIVTSIVDNAVKFSKDGGAVQVSLHRRFNRIVMTVKDQGIGISPEKLPSLLRPFTRGTDSMQYNYEGIGLDLYSDKVIVDKLGGKISITSQLNKGTTVNVSIPINRSKAQGSSATVLNAVS